MLLQWPDVPCIGRGALLLTLQYMPLFICGTQRFRKDFTIYYQRELFKFNDSFMNELKVEFKKLAKIDLQEVPKNMDKLLICRSLG